MPAIVITGTDTEVGKTVVAAGLAMALDADYWKPVQAGLRETTDSERVAALAGCRIIPESYRLDLPASPHLAAENMGITIDARGLALPAVNGLLVVEGAGGVMVPIDRNTFFVDVFARWKAPVILVARTALGTINHTALSLAALRAAGSPVFGVIFNGPPEPDVEQTIVEMCGVRHLGRLNAIKKLNREALAEAFKAIDVNAIRRHCDTAGI